MFSFVRYVLASLRSLSTIALLLLIVQLLTLDTSERRVFVQMLVLRVAAAVESNDSLLADLLSGGHVETPAPEVTDPDPGAFAEPLPSELGTRPSDLPADFVDQLEQAVARSGKRTARAGWAELHAAPDRTARIEAAARLARNLPPQWWTVDGELVNELDLPAVLCNRLRS
jgi:hypothetical protein